MKHNSKAVRSRTPADGATPPVVYPGSFDPATNGHMDIIRRAAHLFSRVVVAVVANPQKTPMFGLDERVAMLRESCGELPNVEIDKFEGLLVDFVRRRGAALVVKGLRIVSDFEHEYSMAVLNRKIKGGIETVFLPARLEYAYLSSSSVREVYALGGDISEFVPAAVLKHMRRAVMERKSK